MTHTGSRSAMAASAAITFLLTASVQPALAQQPEPQLRYFAVVVPTPDTPPPDLLVPASTLLVVHDSTFVEATDLTFCEDAPSELLAGTGWFLRDVTHVSNRGVETYGFYWLDDGSEGGAPPNGAMARTGLDGDAAFVDGPFFVRPAVGSECGGSSTRWWVDDQPTANSMTWYVGVGWFSK